MLPFPNNQSNPRTFHRVNREMIYRLSPRQLEILTLISHGYSTKEIAYLLNISDTSVRTYRAKLYAQARLHDSGHFDYVWPPRPHQNTRPPINAEYLLHLILPRGERDFVIGDLIESYHDVLRRFDKKWRADIWFYKQVIGFLWPLFARAAMKIGACAWLGRVLRRLIS